MSRAARAAAIAALAGGPALLMLGLLHADSEGAVAAVLLVAVALAVVAMRTRAFSFFADAAEESGGLARSFAVVAGLGVILALHGDPFALFLVARVLVIVLACLGLQIQFGFAGVVNFAGAAFFGIGGYAAAVLSRGTPVPHLLILLVGGALAALLGSVLILPVLRTRGHYAALITIAFGILFRTFVEVNDALGGPQGLKVPALSIFGFAFGHDFDLGGVRVSFYIGHALLALALVAVAFAVVERLDRSWVGLSLDAVRLDELAAACFGHDVARSKILAFTVGNFLAGVAGALSALLVGFIAPNNFTFSESLILVSIILLGGSGNPWGLLLAAVIVVLLPEKLQIIQEYRFLLYAALVIAMLLFRPSGLLPRAMRRYFPRSEGLP
jgi:ABC-type branched-subunit amino acid transport system permease subunit